MSFLTLITLLEPPNVEAQEGDVPLEVNDVSPQLWLDYNPSLSLNPNLELYGDIGFRWEIESTRWGRLVVRPGLRSCFSNGLCLMGGVGSFSTFSLAGSSPNFWEIRPFQGARVTWPNWRFLPLQHYVRLEEKFDFNTSTWNSNFVARARYQLSSHIQWRAVRPGRHWRLLGTLEGFKRVAGGERGSREQIRATLGLERSFNTDFRFRGEVTWQKRGLWFASNESVSDIYLRLRVYHRWGSD